MAIKSAAVIGHGVVQIILRGKLCFKAAAGLCVFGTVGDRLGVYTVVAIHPAAKLTAGEEDAAAILVHKYSFLLQGGAQLAGLPVVCLSVRD